MKAFRATVIGIVALCGMRVLAADEPAAPLTQKDALKPFNVLVGDWRGTGTPVGTKEEIQKNFWQEKLSWEWQFKGNDAWLKLTIEKGKHFTGGELRYIPAKEHFELTLRTPAKDTVVFTGTLDKKNLVLERVEKDEGQRLTFTLLHSNRFLYKYEARPAGKNLFSKLYGVGATKEGESFAAGDGKPECIVSGGLGTTPINYMGKTYYVCCSGCRAEFFENPQKYIKEYEEKKKAK